MNNLMNPQITNFMKQLMKQAGPQRGMGGPPQPIPQGPQGPPQAAPNFIPQQPPALNIPPPQFSQGMQPAIPPTAPSSGPSIADRLDGLGQLQAGNWTIDLTDPEQALQYRRRF